MGVLTDRGEAGQRPPAPVDDLDAVGCRGDDGGQRLLAGQRGPADLVVVQQDDVVTDDATEREGGGVTEQPAAEEPQVRAERHAADLDHPAVDGGDDR